MSEEELLEKYGCNSLSEFVDTYLDCETAFDLLRSQFKEIERLNNIINEFDKFLFEELQTYGGGGIAQEYYDKLQELKGSE